jgi:hypothetical protein
MKMRKRILVAACLVIGAISAKADMALSFADASADGNTSGKTDSLILNTGTLAVSGGDLTNATALSGTSTVNDEFTLAVNIGFAFDRTNFAWDTTPSTGTDNNIKYNDNGQGIAPDGDTGKFATGEILFFTVSGLDAGNSLKLSSYTISRRNGANKNVDFLYEHTSGTDGIQRVDTLNSDPVTATAIDVTLSNGDIFGFASWLTNNNSNGNVGGITFDVISEPATLGLITF